MLTTLSTGGGGRVRLVVAGPNLTIDRTAALPELRPGDVLRTRAVAVTPGGKGVNVVRAANALGTPAVLVGFLPGRLGTVAAAMLADEGVTLSGVSTAGELRSTSVLMEDGGRVTVINEPGPGVTAEDWAALEALVAGELGAGPAVLVCSGSVPPGAPADAFARLVDRARAAAAAAVVDANGPLLRTALAAGPDLVTPNLAEAELALTRPPHQAATGTPEGEADTRESGAGARGGLRGGEAREGGAGAAGRLRGEDTSEGVEVDPREARGRALAAAAGLRAAGAHAAVVTAGAAGAAVASADGVHWIAAPRVSVRNPIGAGDVLTAAVAAALARGLGPLSAAVEGVAAASASVEHPRAGTLDPARAVDLATTLHPVP